MSKARTRPAETTGGLAAVATALAAVFGADATVIAVVGTLAGTLPAVVTWLVTHGGLAGLWRVVVRGRAK